MAGAARTEVDALNVISARTRTFSRGALPCPDDGLGAFLGFGSLLIRDRGVRRERTIYSCKKGARNKDGDGVNDKTLEHDGLPLRGEPRQPEAMPNMARSSITR